MDCQDRMTFFSIQEKQIENFKNRKLLRSYPVPRKRNGKPFFFDCPTINSDERRLFGLATTKVCYKINFTKKNTSSQSSYLSVIISIVVKMINNSALIISKFNATFASKFSNSITYAQTIEFIEQENKTTRSCRTDCITTSDKNITTGINELRENFSV